MGRAGTTPARPRHLCRRPDHRGRAADARVSALVRRTALANLPSQQVLDANGFADVGRGMDDDEGETIVWRLEL